MKREHVERRLAAILAADVVGYTRLMGADETGTLLALQAHRRDFVDPTIAQHRGRIVKLMGDGALVEFASALDAAACAAELQLGMAERNADLPTERRIVFRIGINLGDVLIEGDDLYGDGVNVAVRLEALADPGGICLSAKVYEEVRNKLDLGFEDLGAKAVKNIAEPVRVYRVVPNVGTEEKRPALPETDTRTRKPSIAVLPFDNMSGDADQEYFVDGVCEDIITALSRNRWFDVTARNSSFAYKGRSPDVRDVSKALGVGYVLEGSVRKSGSRVRITAQLIDAGTGNHLWADRFDRELDDEFAVQDEIAGRISSILGERIWQSTARNIAHLGPEAYGPYEFAFRAIELVHHIDPRDMAVAERYLLQALELDPDLVPGHLGLGFCYLSNWAFWDDPSGQALEKAHKHAAKMQDLAPDDAQTYRLLSRVLNYKRMFDEARRCMERALNLNPNDGDIIANRGIFHLFGGDFQEAARWIQKVLELHTDTPHTVDIMRYWMALALFAGTDYEAAILTLRSISGLEFIRSELLAACLAGAGQDDQARSMSRRILDIRPNLRVGDIGLWRAFHQEHDQQHLRDALRAAGLPE